MDVPEHWQRWYRPLPAAQPGRYVRRLTLRPGEQSHVTCLTARLFPTRVHYSPHLQRSTFCAEHGDECCMDVAGDQVCRQVGYLLVGKTDYTQPHLVELSAVAIEHWGAFPACDGHLLGRRLTIERLPVPKGGYYKVLMTNSTLRPPEGWRPIDVCTAVEHLLSLPVRARK
jgi:hypothetical protein